MTNQTDAIGDQLRHWAERASDERPLYAAIAGAVANDPDVLALYDEVPEPDDRIPVLLFAAIHHELLGGDPHPLRDWFPSVVTDARTDDPTAAVTDFCRTRTEQLRAVFRSRSVQTNEVGRCAILLPVLDGLGDEHGPLAILEVGTSAGLLLHLDRYRYRYGPHEVNGPSDVVLTCEPRGDAPLPTAVPTIAWRAGLDHSPVDVHSDTDVAWLRACVWTEETDRLRRLDAALDVARTHTARIVTGDAVDDLTPLVVEADEHGHPVVIDVWVLNYLPAARRRAFVSRLDALGRERDLSWIFVEAPTWTPGLPHPDPSIPETCLTIATWRRGERDVRRLAIAHPHGRWLQWQDGAA